MVKGDKNHTNVRSLLVSHLLQYCLLTLCSWLHTINILFFRNDDISKSISSDKSSPDLDDKSDLSNGLPSGKDVVVSNHEQVNEISEEPKGDKGDDLLKEPVDTKEKEPFVVISKKKGTYSVEGHSDLGRLSLWKAIGRTFGLKFLGAAFCKLVYDCLLFVSPYILG